MSLFGDELFQRLAAGGRLGVQADAGLAGVLQIVGGVLLLILGTALVDSGVAQGVAGGGLDLDDLGARSARKRAQQGAAIKVASSSTFTPRGDALLHSYRSSMYVNKWCVAYIFSRSRKVSRLVRTCSKRTI